MEYTKSLDLLGIPRKHINLDKEMIRKAYLKASLKYHPDKYGDNGEKFKEINKAYIYLCENNKFHHNDTENNFDHILEEFIQKFSQKTNWNSVFIKTTIKGIFTNRDDYIIQIFNNLEKNIAIEIFDFLIQLQFFTNWDEEYIKKIKNIIHKKMKHDNIILLNPTIDDLMSDQIYKLNVGNNEFYIPLWHNELYFDLIDFSGNKIDLIVKIIPDISDNMFIDHNNNLIISVKEDLQKVFNDGYLKINIGNKSIKIKSDDLKCTRNIQIFYYKKKGILKMDAKNIFNSSIRSDINIKVELI